MLTQFLLIHLLHLEDIMLNKISYTFMVGTFALVFFFITYSVSAEQVYEVRTDQLNMRQSPSHTAKAVGQLASGDRLVGFNEKFGWVQTYFNDEEVWVASQYLVKRETKNNSYSSEQVTITADSVRLRSGPGIKHPMISYANANESFELIDARDDWLQIKQADGTTAWVARWLTTKAATETASQTTQKATNNVLNGMNIVIDPGHGGIDPGSISLNGKFEKDYSLTVSKMVAKKLEQFGATVIFTREDDTTLSLDKRINVSHAYLTDAFISIHYDAYETNNIHGVSTHYYGSSGSLNLAEAIQNELGTYTDMKSRGIMNSPYYVLRNNQNLAVLIELGFLTNEHDLARIESKEHANNVSEAIYQGLNKYFNN